MTAEAVQLVDDADLVAVVNLALQTGIRTVAEQEALIRVCAQMDNPFVSWTHLAFTSWEGRRCSCGRAIPVTIDNCAGCVRGRQVAS